jgi:uncharacterized protein
MDHRGAYDIARLAASSAVLDGNIHPIPPVNFPLDISHFTAAFADPRFPIAVGITVLCGVVRGFSGFGSALIYIPLMSAVYEPRVAAASFLLIDFFCTIPFAARLYPTSNKREIWPLTCAAALTIPFGAMLLRLVDPVPLRWAIAMVILALVAVLVSGWRLRGAASLPLTIGIGLVSGISGGATQLVGPFAIVYWLGSASGAAVVRANLMVFFALTGAILCVTYFFQDLFPPAIVALAALIALPYVVSLVAGAYLFKGSSELLYRRVAYAIIAAAALASLPLFDGIFR